MRILNRSVRCKKDEMCVNHVAMVPAVVNIVASKGKDTYSGFISEITCFKCRSFSVGICFYFHLFLYSNEMLVNCIAREKNNNAENT